MERLVGGGRAGMIFEVSIAASAALMRRDRSLVARSAANAAAAGSMMERTS